MRNRCEKTGVYHSALPCFPIKEVDLMWNEEWGEMRDEQLSWELQNSTLQIGCHLMLIYLQIGFAEVKDLSKSAWGWTARMWGVDCEIPYKQPFISAFFVFSGVNNTSLFCKAVVRMTEETWGDLETNVFCLYTPLPWTSVLLQQHILPRWRYAMEWMLIRVRCYYC